MFNNRKTTQQRWLVPEVVQTSAMDCGPAALKCLLEGFNIPVSYGRLREACQTNVDGTSIDMLEAVANQLGVHAEQVMIPIDHILLSEAAVLPAMAVVKLGHGATHFVVIWRRHGSWLQVMDPAMGRRWVTCTQFLEEIYHHEFKVPVQDWFEWAASAEFLKPLRQRLALLGAAKTDSNSLIDQALNAPDWFGLATLDAGVRLVNSIVAADGIKSGKPAIKLLQALLASIDLNDIYQTIPLAYWSVIPQPVEPESEKQLLLKGAVLLQVKGKAALIPEESETQVEMAPELAAALHEKPLHPLKTLVDLLKIDGLLSPLALVGALTIAIAAVLVETLLFRGIFDMAWALKLPEQRLAAVVSLLVFISLLLLIEIPIAMESMRFGRHLETRLRMALLRKLPQLTDRYFQSRPVSDMAERSHSIALTRMVPNLGIQCVQTVWDIVFTLTGIMLIDAASSGLALLVTALAIALPLMAQPLLNEKDLRVRSHAGALFSFYLDALLGLVPIRTHHAELPVCREHEGLLVEWARSSRSFIQLSLAIEGVQALICKSFVVLLLFQHFQRSGAVMGGDLLLVFWALKLPAIGQKLSGLAHQYPAQRNILLRLLEPLATPEELVTIPAANNLNSDQAIHTEIKQDAVAVLGQSILQDINRSLAPGEHVAVGDLLQVYWALKLPASGQNLNALAQQYPAQREILHRLLETQAKPATTTNPPENPPKHRLGVHIEMRDGNVVAAGHSILQDINLSITAGEHVAIVGPSGAGKSSFVGLLLGWHRLASGALWVDGLHLNVSNQQALREETAWVDPAVQLWNRSFLDNLSYSAGDSGIDRIASAIDGAALRGVLQKLPSGLQTYLGEGGALLSGGEGQRVRLGRALLQTGVRLVLLDEPFRGMDRSQREQLLRESRQWWADATLLCVTHDVAETLSFKRVLVVEDGKIIEDDAPHSLAARDSRYRDLLNAEKMVRQQMWQGKNWRRIQVSNGAIHTSTPHP